jgi:catechol 2,3-dioxygenase-like lactoylglutathione lyase family enzyme
VILKGPEAPIREAVMFDKSQPFSGFSVDDIPAAKKFYTEVMEMSVGETNGMLSLQIRPDVAVLVYPTQHHRPASYTLLNFPVDDIDAAIDHLAEHGVTMERYDGMPQDDKGVMRGLANDMGPDIAWFKDPAGNVLSVLQDS